MTMHPFILLTRLHQPIGIWLLFFPAAWAVALVAPDAAVATLMLVMLLGAALTRSAGCILNDLTDRRLDAQVARTQHRPLASGAVTQAQALLLLAVLLLLALALALSLPLQVFWLALLAVPMIAAYPWMKRITGWPQMFLGITFNLAALFGWLATGQPLTLAAGLLYLAAALWTLGYDTIYAVQDMVDDARVGIRSSARSLGLTRVRLFVACCYAGMLISLGFVGWLQGVGLPYFLGWMAAAIQAGWQIFHLPPSTDRAARLFRSNQWLGLFFLMGVLGERVL
jgi:4-hydroxybenzoate polyprenyltransferase